jgi:hypothetical protein
VNARRLGGRRRVTFLLIALLFMALIVTAGVPLFAAGAGDRAGKVLLHPKVHWRIVEAPQSPAEKALDKEARLLDRISESPSPHMLRALARGRHFVLAFSALTPGTVKLRWKLGSGRGRVVAEATRRYQRTLWGPAASITLSATPAGRRVIERIGARLASTPAAGAAEFSSPCGEPFAIEHSTALSSEAPEPARTARVAPA